MFHLTSKSFQSNQLNHFRSSSRLFVEMTTSFPSCENEILWSRNRSSPSRPSASRMISTATPVPPETMVTSPKSASRRSVPPSLTLNPLRMTSSAAKTDVAARRRRAKVSERRMPSHTPGNRKSLSKKFVLHSRPYADRRRALQAGHVAFRQRRDGGDDRAPGRAVRDDRGLVRVALPGPAPGPDLRGPEHADSWRHRRRKTVWSEHPGPRSERAFRAIRIQ